MKGTIDIAAISVAIIVVGRVVTILIGAMCPGAREFIIKFTRADKSNRTAPYVVINLPKRKG